MSVIVSALSSFGFGQYLSYVTGKLSFIPSICRCFSWQQDGYIQVLLEANGLAAGKDHQFKGRYDAEKNAVIISLEKDEQSALSPQKCTT